MIRAKNSVAVAVAVAVATGIGGCGAPASNNSVSNNSGSPETYCAELPDSVGLYAGNPVTQMGFEIGTIDSITEKQDRVEVIFTTKIGRVLPVDVKAVTRSKSILADRSLELVGNHTTGPTLQPSSCIPLRNGYTPKTISEVVGSAADFLGALSPEGNENTVADAISGVHQALQGQGEPARAMMLNATEAMEDPDKFVADLGSSITAMAPLNEQALADWGAVTSLLGQLPQNMTSIIELFPSITNVTTGIGWLVAALYDIQPRYGNDIWPFVHGPVAQAISLAAGRSGDIAGLVGSIPSLTAVLNEQSRTNDGLRIHHSLPKIPLGDSTEIDPANLLGEILMKGTGN